MNKLKPLFPKTATLGLNTDLYELTMAAAYYESGRHQEWATFELFTRTLPANRNFLVSAGLEQALHYILNTGFTADTLSYLRGLDVFSGASDSFFDYLSDFAFSGDVSALPEGTLFFENEPILQVSAPVIEAQILETFLINTMNLQSMVASKAARLCLAAGGRGIVDFGSRRAHGPQTGVLAARASYIGGCSGTSNVLAGYELGIPVFGTMAHSFIQFFDDEEEAFREFYKVFPHNSIILVDTYDTLQGVRRALRMDGPIQGIRLDSGDLEILSLESRRLLDEAGRKDVQIVASGSLDEQSLLSFTLKDLPIDAYGIGTELVVSPDAPTCDLVYKLVEVIRGEQVFPRIKASEEKSTYPFRKQIYRHYTDQWMEGDVICAWDEAVPRDQFDLKPLLQQYIRKGKLVQALPTPAQTREHVQKQLQSLPASYKGLHSSEVYSTSFSQSLRGAQTRLIERYTAAD